jgi:hypothetical protein
MLASGQATVHQPPKRPFHPIVSRVISKPAGSGVFLMDRPEAWDQIGAALGVSSDREWATIEQLRAWRRDLNAAATRLAT